MARGYGVICYWMMDDGLMAGLYLLLGLWPRMVCLKWYG